jgi:hypothetical protein
VRTLLAVLTASPDTDFRKDTMAGIVMIVSNLYSVFDTPLADKTKQKKFVTATWRELLTRDGNQLQQTM